MLRQDVSICSAIDIVSECLEKVRMQERGANAGHVCHLHESRLQNFDVYCSIHAGHLPICVEAIPETTILSFCWIGAARLQVEEVEFKARSKSNPNERFSMYD